MASSVIDNIMLGDTQENYATSWILYLDGEGE